MTKVIRLIIAVILLDVSTAMAQPGGEASAMETETERQRTVQQLIDEYLRLAIAKSPTIAALQAKQRSSRELVGPAGALPDPMVGIMYQSIGPPWKPMGPMSMVQGEFSQVIPGIGKRAARRQLARAESDVRRTEIEVTKSQIVADVRTLVAGIYTADRERRAIEQASAVIEVLLGAVTGRFISGMVDQEAIAKTQLERSRLKEQSLDIEANRQMLVTRLNRLLVRDADAKVPSLDALPESALDIDAIRDDDLLQSPELRVRKAAISAAHRRHESAETENRSNYLVGFAGGATTDGSPVIVLRFGMELPLWSASKQEPLVRAARHDTEAAESEYRATELQLRADVTVLMTRLKRDTEQLALYRSVIVPNAELALNAARSAYAAGRGDFATVIEDYRAWFDTQVGLARRQADRLVTWAELSAILNRER